MKNTKFSLITLFITLLMLMVCPVQAQLTCSGCAAGTPSPILPAGGGTYSNPIVLTKDAVFTIAGSGDFHLTGIISQNSGRCDFTLIAPNATLFLGADNTYSGATNVWGTLGGTSSLLESPATVTGGATIFGGTGTGNAGTLTVKKLTFSAKTSALAVYSSPTALSLIKAGADGKGKLKAVVGTTINIMEPITLAEGDYPIILANTVAKQVSDFRINKDNSGRCIRVIQTGNGIYLRIAPNATVTGDAMACPGGIVSLTASGSGITKNTPGEWTAEGNGYKLKPGETQITEATENPAAPAKSKIYFYMHDKNEGTATASFKMSGCNVPSNYTFKVLSQPAPVLFIHPDANRRIDAGVNPENNPGIITIRVAPPAGTRFTWDVLQSKDNGDLQVSKDGSALMSLPNLAGFSFSAVPQTEPIVFNVTAAARSMKDLIVNIYPQLTAQDNMCRGVPQKITIPVRAAGNTTNMPGSLEVSNESGIDQNKPVAVCNGSETEIKIGTTGDGNLYEWYRMDRTNVKEEIPSPAEKKEATVVKQHLTAAGKQAEHVFYYITSSNGTCEVSTTIPVAVYPVPEITKISDHSSICSSSAVAIELATNIAPEETDRVTYTWTVSENKVGATGESTGVKIMSPQTLINSEITEESVTYTFTPYYTNGAAACTGKPAASQVLVKASFKTGSITGVEAAAVCLGDQIAPLSIAPVGNGTRQYQWMKDGETIADAHTATYQIPTAEISSGSYTVKVSSECETKTSEAKLLNVTADAYFVNEQASASAAPAEAGLVKFTYTGPAAVYSWDFNDNSPVSSLQNPEHKYDRAGTWTPVLTVVKSVAQTRCNKKFILSPIEITAQSKTLTGDTEPRRGISVYPVPAKDQVTISSRDELTGIILSDASGRNIMNHAACGQEKTILLSTLLPGLYILQIITRGEVNRVKIIKE